MFFIFRRPFACVLNLLVFGWHFTFSIPLYAAGKPSISGNLPRSNSPEYFDFSFSVGSLSDSAAGIGSDDDLFKDRVQIFLPKVSASNPIDMVSCQNGEFYASLPEGAPNRTGSSSENTLTYRVRVMPCGSKSLSQIFVSSGSKSIAVKVNFRDSKSDSKYAESDETILTALASIPKDVPTLKGVSSDDSTIVVEYAATTTPTYVDGKSYSTSTLYLLAIDVSEIQANSGRFVLPTRILNATAEEDDIANAAQSCTYVMNSDRCVVCPTTNSYIDLARVSNSYIKTSSASTTSTKRSIRGLVNDKQYAVFLVYENGTTPSLCKTETPLKTYTLAENLGEEGTKESDPKCFIATAAFGSPHHPNLKIFRWFRDSILQKFALGSQFVEWYYTNSPSIAEKLKQNPSLQSGVAAVLWPLAIILSLIKFVVNSPRVLAGVVIIPVAVLLGSHRWLQKKKKAEHDYD